MEAQVEAILSTNEEIKDDFPDESDEIMEASSSVCVKMEPDYENRPTPGGTGYCSVQGEGPTPLFLLKAEVPGERPDQRYFQSPDMHLYHRPSSRERAYPCCQCGERPYPCEMCGKAFITSSRLSHHRKFHVLKGEEPEMIIDEGSAVFVKESEGNFAPEEDPLEPPRKPKRTAESYKCQDCGKGFTNQTAFAYHKRIHTGEKYPCGTCGKEFATKQGLFAHQMREMGNRPYACDHCDKAFSLKGDLARHLKTHSGERYVCVNCGKSYTSKEGLLLHQKREAGERPYACEECGKAFFSEPELVLHVRSHTGETPYACDNCEKAFPSSSRLSVHKMTVHGTKKAKVACEICWRMYRPDFLKYHKCRPYETKREERISMRRRKKPRRKIPPTSRKTRSGKTGSELLEEAQDSETSSSQIEGSSSENPPPEIDVNENSSISGS